MQLTLITGGARSGKSSFAQKLAGEKAVHYHKAGVIYLATALVGDEEMQRRVSLHQQSRPRGWKTIEEPYDPAATVGLIPDNHLLLLDCLTVWVTNLLFSYLEKENDPLADRTGQAGQETGWDTIPGAANKAAGQTSHLEREAALEDYILEETDRLLEALNRKALTSILVSNEVGWGIVPEHYLGRLFRDLAGRVNQKIAARATNVYLVTAGIPLKIKG
jgi:adenosylcobinamide kinase/adenosylcobinamide-phosphate guanylyltransferase